MRCRIEVWLGAVALLAGAGARERRRLLRQLEGPHLSTAALPAAFPNECLPALKVWGAWASEHHLRLDVDTSGARCS
jgi:hypothetical protein